MELSYQTIGERIRAKRKEKGWTQAVLAERAGIEPSNLSHIERAATKLSLPTLISIANALDATLDELVYGNLKQSRHVSVDMLNALLADCTPEETAALTQIVRTAKTVLRQQHPTDFR